LKTLLLDIETAPNLAHVWGLWQQNVGINQIIDAGYTLCWAAKWLGDRKVMFSGLNEDTAEDMIQKIYDLVDEADAVVHYNGTKFDMPTLNKEFLLNQHTPPSPYKQIDLLRTARGQFRFPSNKLDYIAQALDLGSKTKHVGHQLWIDCMQGDKKAWKTMKEYNIQDVNLLEKVYNKLLPWIVSHPHHALYNTDTEKNVCHNCGSEDMRRQGYAYTPLGKFQQFQCKSCGKWMRAKKSLAKVDVR